MQKKKMEKTIRKTRKKLKNIFGDYINLFFDINKKIDENLDKKDNQKARETLRTIYIKYGEEAIALARKIDKYMEVLEDKDE